MFTRIPVFFLTFLLFCCTASAQTLTREGGRFLLDGVLISPFGIRAANALNSDANVQALVANLPLMQEHGIQSVNVSLQCAFTGTCNAYNNDGTLKGEVMGRLDTVLAALRARKMVGVVTLFYDDRPGSPTTNANIYKAVRAVVRYLKPRRDLWLYAVNEPNNDRLDPWAVGKPEMQKDIYNIIKFQEDPDRIVFVNPDNNDGFIARTSGQPVCNGDVNVEMDRFDEYDSPGIFSTSDRATIVKLIQDTHACNGYFFVHSAWHQKSDAPGWPQFGKGGSGSSTSPGMAFAWDTMQALATNPPGPDPVPPPGEVHTENRHLTWDHTATAIHNIAGFRVYMRDALNEAPVMRVQIANPAARSIDVNLAVGTWYLMLTAYDGQGRESAFSNEVITTITAPEPEPQCPVIEPCQCPGCPEPEPCPACPPLPTALICQRGFTALPHASGGMEVRCAE